MSYRERLQAEVGPLFRDLLEEAWGWDEALVGKASFPAWPYVGPRYGEGPRILIVGQAHEQWPSTTVGPDSRKAPHLERYSEKAGFRVFRNEHTLENFEDILENLRWLNDTFIEEVERGGYSSAFWRFIRHLLNEMGAGWRSFAWTNTYPFCKHPRGMPSEQLKDQLREFRFIVGKTADALDAQHVVILGSGDWQSNAEAMFPLDWCSVQAPFSTWKTDEWAHAEIPGGGTALRTWHPGRLGSIKRFAQETARLLSADLAGDKE